MNSKEIKRRREVDFTNQRTKQSFTRVRLGSDHNELTDIGPYIRQTEIQDESKYRFNKKNL